MPRIGSASPAESRMPGELSKRVSDPTTIDLLDRAKEYLHAKNVPRKGPLQTRAGLCSAFKAVFLGTFFNLGDTRDEGLKDEVFNENVQVAFVSAVLLSCALPAAIENTHDIFEISSFFSESDFSESAAKAMLCHTFKFCPSDDVWKGYEGYLGDLIHALFWTGAMLSCASMSSSVITLMVVNVLGTDEKVSTFINGMGKVFFVPLSRVPFLCFMYGSISLMLGSGVRLLLTTVEQTGLIVEIVAVAVGVALSIYWLGKCFITALNAYGDNESYLGMDLSGDEVSADLELYIEHEHDPSLKGFLFALQCKTPSGGTVPLTELSKQLATIAYLAKNAELLRLGDSRKSIAERVLLAQLDSQRFPSSPEFKFAKAKRDVRRGLRLRRQQSQNSR